MPSISAVLVPPVLLIWSLFICQSVAAPMPLHVKRDNTASLSIRSIIADGEIHPRFAGALFGGLATTVVGNALGGAISPMFAKVGEKLSAGKTRPEPPPEEEQTEQAPAEVPATQGKSSKVQPAATETEVSSKDRLSTKKTEKSFESEKKDKSEKLEESEKLESADDD